MAERMSGWLAVLILTLLVAGTFWVDRASRVDEVQPTLRAGEPDFSISKFHAVQMDMTGMPQYVLAALHMDHFPEGDVGVLTNPVMTDLTTGQPAIRVAAPEARVFNASRQIVFDREVQIVRDAAPGASRLVVNTSRLTVLTGQGTAYTQMPVDARDDTMHITAVGMDLDKNTRQLRLHSQVRTTYVKPHP